MELTHYYKMQEYLDNNILETKGLERSNLITEKKVIAFKQEFGECLQRLPEVFKFWSNKKNIIDDETLEEWVDGFHFLLSIAIDRGYDKYIKNVSGRFYMDEDMTDLVNEIYNSPVDSIGEFSCLFEAYMAVIKKLGYEEEDIKRVYDLKNAENLARQEAGY